jgi:hypothetical protein
LLVLPVLYHFEKSDPGKGTFPETHALFSSRLAANILQFEALLIV